MPHLGSSISHRLRTHLEPFQDDFTQNALRLAAVKTMLAQKMFDDTRLVPHLAPALCA